MITTDHQDGLVAITVFGELTLADFNEFEDLIRYKLKFDGPVSLFIDLSQMATFTLDVAWEEVRFSYEHMHDFKRIAVVTASPMVSWGAWLSQAFVDADLQVFEDAAQARVWLDEVR